MTTYEYRLEGMLAPVLHQDLKSITAQRATAIYASRAAATKVDTHRNELITVQRFAAWCVRQRWATENAFADVESVGVRSRGKRQLREDEAKKLLDLALAENSDEGLAVAMALLMGLRASEITDRIVRDVDAGGTVLWIEHAKTRSGERRIRIPAVLQPRIRALVTDRDAAAPLFGGHDRYWLHAQTVRLSKAAGVPRVTPHGLRGTAASIAVKTMDIESVARALGHASPHVTRAHYAEPDAVDAGEQAARVLILTGEAK